MTEGALTIDSGELTLSALEGQVNELKDQIQATHSAQKSLNFSANALAEFLHEFNESESSYDLVSYSNKLNDVGRRIKGVDKTLTEVHDRLSSIQRKIAREVYKNKQTITKFSPEAVIPVQPAT